MPKVYTPAEIKAAAKLTAWLADRPLLNINALERLCNVPQASISKAIGGTSPLSPKHVPALADALKKYGFK
jgi:hypothetical protein